MDASPTATPGQNIAGAWSLNQTFPSFALIGPRNIREIDTSLPSLDISISKEKSDWLNYLLTYGHPLSAEI